MALLKDGLEARVGSELSSLRATVANVQAWNREAALGLVSSFDFRVLLGIGIGQQRPEHGDVAAFHEDVGQKLGRSSSWIRQTVQVAGELRLAIAEDVPVPAEIRQIPWRFVPNAIANVRAGRALDYAEKTKKPALTHDEMMKDMRRYIRELRRMEEGQPDTVRESVALLLKFAKKHDIAVPQCQLGVIEEATEPATRTVAEVPDIAVAPDPVDELAEPARPGRRRPRGAGPRGGRRGRPSGGVRGDNDQ